MRTRRSPRQQEILWRALGGAPKPTPATAPIRTDVEIDVLAVTEKTKRLLKRDAARERVQRLKRALRREKGSV